MGPSPIAHAYSGPSSRQHLEQPTPVCAEDAAVIFHNVRKVGIRHRSRKVQVKLDTTVADAIFGSVGLPAFAKAMAGLAKARMRPASDGG